ncbi:reverse transcriptase [Canna indica]|uniref:Reverse transcriptase n=1 Tax=Canna indica TaxID=4628 RepID=A0AAQ3KIU4_9LILI|nr:reverse transcriptase [Canna indica]
MPWLIIGDYNCIDNSDDKRGGLMEIKFEGNSFTWDNKRKGARRIQARLDKGLVNWEWIDMYSSNTIKHLNMIAFDHRPLLTAESKHLSKNFNRKFIFEHHWLEMDGIEQIIKENWCPDSCNKVQSLSEIGSMLSKMGKNISVWARHNICPIEKELKASK